ncbi:MAG TPA: YbaK/EbsC family protein [bacterium]|nr:YbaK/EbsC family protein [bacterium]
MSIPIKVKKYLDKQDIDYQEIVHKTVYTAFDAAQTLKKELNQIAKNLLVQVDKTYVLVVVPADKKINLVKVKRAFGAKKISIPNEKLMINSSRGTIKTWHKIWEKCLTSSQEKTKRDSRRKPRSALGYPISI